MPRAWTSPCPQALTQTPNLLPGRPPSKLGNVAHSCDQPALWLKDRWDRETSGKGPETLTWHLQVGRAFRGSLSNLVIWQLGRPKAQRGEGTGHSHSKLLPTPPPHTREAESSEWVGRGGIFYCCHVWVLLLLFTSLKQLPRVYQKHRNSQYVLGN